MHDVVACRTHRRVHANEMWFGVSFQCPMSWFSTLILEPKTRSLLMAFTSFRLPPLLSLHVLPLLLSSRSFSLHMLLLSLSLLLLKRANQCRTLEVPLWLCICYGQHLNMENMCSFGTPPFSDLLKRHPVEAVPRTLFAIRFLMVNVAFLFLRSCTQATASSLWEITP